jgi:hypothetical protein
MILQKAIESCIKTALEHVHTALPAKIVSYAYKKQTASIKPLVRHILPDGSSIELPIINNVPVSFQRSGEASLTMPVKKDDTGIMLCSEKSIDLWLSNGKDSTPNSSRKFDLSDAFFIPGIFPLNKDSYATNNTDLLLKYKNSSITIKENGDIEIGNGILKALVTDDFLSHTHVFSGAVSGTTCSGTTNPAVELVPSKTSKVKAL